MQAQICVPQPKTNHTHADKHYHLQHSHFYCSESNRNAMLLLQMKHLLANELWQFCYSAPLLVLL